MAPAERANGARYECRRPVADGKTLGWPSASLVDGGRAGSYLGSQVLLVWLQLLTLVIEKLERTGEAMPVSADHIILCPGLVVRCGKQGKQCIQVRVHS